MVQKCTRTTQKKLLKRKILMLFTYFKTEQTIIDTKNCIIFVVTLYIRLNLLSNIFFACTFMSGAVL